MSGPGTAMGISVTTVTTDQQAPLGFIHTVPASVTGGTGEQQWVYVRVDPAAGAPLAIGEFVSLAGFDVVQTTPLAQNPVLIIGVAQHAIAQGSWGFILKNGVGLILEGATGVPGPGIASGEPFLCGAGGAALIATATQPACGFTMGVLDAGAIGQARIALV